MPAPHRVDFPKTCWCGKEFHRGLEQRLAAFRAQTTCCKEHQIILDSHLKNGTPLEEDYDPEEERLGAISCTACRHTLLDSEVDEPCNKCNEGSEFSRPRKLHVVSDILPPRA